MSDSQAGPSTQNFVKPVEVLYCDVCSFPPEYCAYGSRLSKCKKWLSDAHPSLYTKLYGEEAAGPSSTSATKTTTSSSSKKKSSKDKTTGEDNNDDEDNVDEVQDANSKMDGLTLDEAKEAAKKEAKAERKAAKEAERISNAKITIRRLERTKRKMTTSIHGLDAFSIDMKKASKLFANKFATGASVSKNAAGEDEIVIQGDVAYEVEEMLLKKTGKEGELFGGRVPEDNIDIIDVKKKKAAEE